MKGFLSGLLLFCWVFFPNNLFAGNFIADAGDFISFKILPVYSFGQLYITLIGILGMIMIGMG